MALPRVGEAVTALVWDTAVLPCEPQLSPCTFLGDPGKSLVPLGSVLWGSVWVSCQDNAMPYALCPVPCRAP